MLGGLAVPRHVFLEVQDLSVSSLLRPWLQKRSDQTFNTRGDLSAECFLGLFRFVPGLQR
jgi:hypothetical protein